MDDLNRLYAVRGATCAKNTKSSLSSVVPELYKRLVDLNGINESDVVSIQFTMTKDLNALNPAFALREAGFASDIPLFTSQESPVKKGLKKVVRILITYYGKVKPTPLYLNGAEILRPDLTVNAE